MSPSAPKPGSFMRTLRGVWQLARPFRRTFVYGFLLIVATAALELVTPYIVKLLIDGLTEGSLAFVPALQLVALGAVVELGLDALYYHQSDVLNRVLFRFEMHLLGSGLGALLGLSLGYHERSTSGQKASRITRGAGNVDNILNSLAWDVIPAIASIITTAIALAFVAWWVVLIFLASIPIFVALTIVVDMKNRPFRKKIQTGYERSSGQLTQAALHVQTVQTTGQEAFERTRHDATAQTILDAVDGQRRVWNRWGYLRNVTNILARTLLIGMSVAAVLTGQFTVGTFALVSTLTAQALGRLFRLTRTYDRIVESSESVNRLLQLFAAESEIREVPEALPLEHIEGRIALKQVAFRYRPDRPRALDGITLHVEPGQFVALVGPSGGGKSTLAKLLLRHYDPEEGSIHLDGKNLRTLQLRSLRRAFGVVTQDVELFNGTIAENIAYAEPDVPRERVEAVAKLAYADEFIATLPKGYETKIGERGIKLSGGQRQRIGIARALLLDPRILIFDEATSHLDSESERRIQDALEQLRHGRTVIVIAHRLSTIQRADRIFVIEGGKLVEEGTNVELQHREGLYARLAALQSMGELRT